MVNTHIHVLYVVIKVGYINKISHGTSLNFDLKHRKMKVEENVAKEKCLKAPKCFWYYKGGCYISPYTGCVRNKAQKGE